MALSDEEITAYREKYPDVDIAEWNKEFLKRTDLVARTEYLKQLIKALLILYEKWTRIADKWLIRRYYEWRGEMPKGGDLVINRNEWHQLTVDIEIEVDAVEFDLRPFADTIMGHLTPAMKDAHIYHMTKMRLEKPDEAMKMEAFGGRRF